MDVNYQTAGLCNSYMVQVIKNDVQEYSLRSVNAKRFCGFLTDQWTIIVVSDTCSLPQSQGTTSTTTPITTTPITSCATGWTNSISNSSKSFCLVTTKATWFNALMNCQNIAAQGTLATISNAFEQSQLNSIVYEHQAPCPDTWIGANDINQLGNFQWSDGQPLVYTNWEPGQPDLNNRCTAAQLQTNGQWITEPCGVDNCFVCQKYTA
uniref:C-type lectin domain-containing protein n=1 Tax=Plectus sambesii TaxID=2011161 RepID=A0A914UV42_9BILA